jgi:hypothetical protein
MTPLVRLADLNSVNSTPHLYVQTFCPAPHCVLATIHSVIRSAFQDGDNKLLICDLAQKLKVYKGTSLIVEHAMLDKPVSQCVTYTDYAMPRVPSISVAAGSNIFIYRHIRPYRKWTCPNVDISEIETNVSGDAVLCLGYVVSGCDNKQSSSSCLWHFCCLFVIYRCGQTSEAAACRPPKVRLSCARPETRARRSPPSHRTTSFWK